MTNKYYAKLLLVLLFASHPTAYLNQLMPDVAADVVSTSSSDQAGTDLAQLRDGVVTKCLVFDDTDDPCYTPEPGSDLTSWDYGYLYMTKDESSTGDWVEFDFGEKKALNSFYLSTSSTFYPSATITIEGINKYD